MNTISIILATISAMLIIEGLFLAIFNRKIRKSIKKLKEKDIRGLGFIEIIIALIILLLISF